MATKKQVHYRNVGGKPAELSSGRLLAIGDSTPKVDADDPMDKALLDAGTLVPVETGEDEKEKGD